MANVLKLERGPHGSTALTRIKVELAELPGEKLLQVNLQVQEAVATVFGALPEVQGMRARIAKELPAFDLANIDKLALFAEAVAEADAGLRIVPSSDHRNALLPEAKRQRTLLHALATALTCQGLLRPTAIKRLKGGNGYLNLSYDLHLLSNALQTASSKLEKSYPMPLAELDRASKLAFAMGDSGPAEAAASSYAAAQDLRSRAFTLMIVAYNEVRRALAYLRAHEGDAESIAPGLYKGRPRRRTARGRKAP